MQFICFAIYLSHLQIYLTSFAYLSFYIHESYLSFFDLLYAWLLIASYFFSDFGFCLANLIYLSCNRKMCFVVGSILQYLTLVTEHVCVVATKDKMMGSIST